MRTAVAALALTCLLVSCGRAPLRNARIDPSLQKVVPPDTTVLFDIHLDRLRQTPVYQKLQPQLSGPSDDFTKKTGIRPADIDEVLSCSNGKNTVVFSRFNIRDVAARLQSGGARPPRYNGVNIYADETSAVALLDSSIGVAGSVPAVHSIIDQTKRGGGGIPAAFDAALDAVSAQDQVWAAMVGGVPGIKGQVEGNPNLANLVRLAQSIDSASLGARIDNDVNIHARADCRSEEDARQVHDALRGFIALGRLATSANRPELLKLYDAISVTREKAIVRVTAMLTPQDLDSILALREKNRR